MVLTHATGKKIKKEKMTQINYFNLIFYSVNQLPYDDSTTAHWG